MAGPRAIGRHAAVEGTGDVGTEGVGVQWEFRLVPAVRDQSFAFACPLRAHTSTWLKAVRLAL